MRYIFPLILVAACDRREPDILARFAALTPTCGAPEPYVARAPVKIGIAEIPLDDATIRDKVTCHGPDVRLTLSRDDHQATRAIEIVVTADTPAEVRPHVTPPLTGLVPPDAVRSILADLDQVLSEPHHFGDIKVQSHQDLLPPPVLPPRRDFHITIRWR